MRFALAIAALSLSACCKNPLSQGNQQGTTTQGTATTTTNVPAPDARAPDGMPVNIPTSRTAAPSLADWDAAPSLSVPTAAPLRCEVNMIREWVRVNCSGKRRSGGTPTALEVKGGCTRDTYTSMKTNANLVTALSRGNRCEVEFTWTDGKEIFVADFSGGKPRPALGFQTVPGTVPAPTTTVTTTATATAPNKPVIKIPTKK